MAKQLQALEAYKIECVLEAVSIFLTKLIIHKQATRFKNGNLDKLV